MNKFTLKDLEQSADNWYSRMKAESYRKYHLCKRLGFSTSEAAVLKAKPDAIIAGLAVERGYIKDVADIEFV